MKKQDPFDMPGDWIFKFVPWWIAFVAVIVVGWFVFTGYMLVTHGPDVLTWVSQYGLRGLWCGQTGCP